MYLLKVHENDLAIMNENIALLNIFNREGQLILKNEHYI